MIENGQAISNTNIATLVISIISIIFIYTIKVHINKRFKSKLIIPIPVELIIVVIATLISYFANFNGRWGVEIVGILPIG